MSQIVTAPIGNRPRLLDLFCCGGGAGMGYAQAGFEVVGVDIEHQPHYPFEFHQADALAYLAEHGHEFDAIHASPPCQAYSAATTLQRAAGTDYPDLLAPTRDALDALGLPYVIENVPRSPMRPDLRLCGCFFGLPLRRERWFELNWSPAVLLPDHEHSAEFLTVVGHGQQTFEFRRLGRRVSVDERRAAMGIDWLPSTKLSQAIPPAYTKLIGLELLHELAAVAA